MAVTVNKEIIYKEPSGLMLFPVKSGETIYKGTLVAIGKDGYLYNLDSDACKEALMVGIVADDSANKTPAATTASGSISGNLEEGSAIAGDKTVRMVYTKGTFRMTFTSITQAMVGQTMYATDNYTIDNVQTAGIPIGTLITYISSTEGYLALNEFYRGETRVLKVALTAASDNTVGGVLKLANPLNRTILVEGFVLDVTTAPTDTAGGVDAGIAANSSTSSDNLIDGLVLAAAGVYNNIDNKGTNGKAYQKWTSSQYLNISSVVSSHYDLTALVGTATIYYRIFE